VTDETERLNLTDGQKTRLLGLALGPHPPGAAADPDEERGDLLWAILRRPMGPPPTQAMPVAAAGSCPGPGSLARSPLDESLQDPRTDVAVLREIKDYAKSLGEQAASQAERDVFLAVYFAAIASALTLHGERITQHTTQDLARFFNAYPKRTWIPSELSTIFGHAYDILTMHAT